MGGSYDEHTALKGKSEAKMVLFFNNLTSFEEQLKRRGEFVEEIQKHLCQLQQEKPFKVKFEVQSSEEPNSRSLSFKLSSPELQQEVEFDVQPAYDVLYELRNNTYAEPQFYNKVYAQLIHECTTLEKEGDFSICFTDLHQNFMRYRAPKLWNLIRLVKHWYQLCKEKLREPLPPQYALELLTVYVWEHSNKNQEKVTTAKNFRTFLELVAYYKNLRIYWTWYYDFRHQEVCAYLCRQLKKARLQMPLLHCCCCSWWSSHGTGISKTLHDPFSPGPSIATEAALSPMAFHGLSQCQASAALLNSSGLQSWEKREASDPGSSRPNKERGWFRLTGMGPAGKGGSDLDAVLLL